MSLDDLQAQLRGALDQQLAALKQHYETAIAEARQQAAAEAQRAADLKLLQTRAELEAHTEQLVSAARAETEHRVREAAAHERQGLEQQLRQELEQQGVEAARIAAEEAERRGREAAQLEGQAREKALYQQLDRDFQQQLEHVINSTKRSGELQREAERRKAQADLDAERERARAELETERQRVGSELEGERARLRELEAERERLQGQHQQLTRQNEQLHAEREHWIGERNQWHGEREQWQAERARIESERQAERDRARQELDAERERLQQQLDAERGRVRQELDGERERLRQELQGERERAQAAWDQERQQIHGERERAQSGWDQERQQLHAARDNERQQARAEFESELDAVRAEIESELQGVRADLQAERERGRALLAQPAPGTSFNAAAVASAIRDLDDTRTLTQALDVVVQHAAALAGRAAVFVVNGDRLRAWSASGIPGVDVQSVESSIGSRDLLARAIQQGQAAAASDETAAPPFARLQAGASAFAVPIMIGGRAVAIAYADAAGDALDVNIFNSLELLGRHASTVVALRTAMRTLDVLRGVGADVPGNGDAAADDQAARRFARLLVSEIKLYNEAAVRAGRQQRDLLQRLGVEIDRARRLYEERVPPSIAARQVYFQQELVQTLADGDPALLGHQ